MSKDLPMSRSDLLKEAGRFSGRFIKDAHSFVNSKRPSFKLLFFYLFLLVGLIYAGKYAYSFVASPKPTIVLDTPVNNAEVTGDKLYVSGKVTPVGASVKVNGSEVAANGDGGFTAVVSIPEGKSSIKVEADYHYRKAELLQLVDRQLTADETAEKEKQKKMAELKQRQNVLGADQKIEEMLVTYNNANGNNYITVLNHDITEQLGFKKITGEVLNKGTQKAYWIEVTANFFDMNDNPVDSKVGFAVGLDQPLNPGDRAKFETQSTTKDFAYYKLNVNWRTTSGLGGAEDSVKLEGDSTTSAKIDPASKTATKSAIKK